jgi:hypothetical protein
MLLQYLQETAVPELVALISALVSMPSPPQRPLRAMLPFGRFEAFKIMERRVMEVDGSKDLVAWLQLLGNALAFVEMMQRCLVSSTSAVPCVSCVVCRVSCVVCRVSCVVCRVSCVVCRVSCVVCRVSCVVCRVSCVACASSLSLSLVRTAVAPVVRVAG